VGDAIAAVDAIVLALWLDDLREVIPQEAHLLDGKVVVRSLEPCGLRRERTDLQTLPDEQSAGSIVAALLPSGAHYVKAFGTLAADSLAASANREPHRAALFYATDDHIAATTVEHLIRGAGFAPLKAGGVSDAGRTEGPGGDLSQFGLAGEIIDLDRARTALACRSGRGRCRPCLPTRSAACRRAR
jgi:8-hydroxy-5-deazaflavin:NADPH oxidoreductase